ncbi:MAG: hypothetical protein F4213_13350 [Boseongicola sp. SB0677_bin_26]|nr:hypothetical protein [Boseongicola sp. SB0677_bin_26]
MTHYIGVVEKDPGSAWGVWLPDVAGCTSAADEVDDLFPNACQALVLHLEDLEAPHPRSADEILELQNVRDAFGRGTFLMMVPLLSVEARSGGTHVAGVVGTDPGSAWGVWLPDIPGCHLAADSDQDVPAMASEALDVHLDGDEMPRVRPLAEILRIEEVREDLGRGDFLVSVPLPPAGQVSREARER